MDVKVLTHQISRIRWGGVWGLMLAFAANSALAAQSQTDGRAVTPLAKRVVTEAGRLLEEAQVSYVYGGYQVGDGDTCRRCNDCLNAHQPEPKQRLKQCPVCGGCSLDCSHFTALVFKEAGAPYPYLDTATMLRLSAADLLRRYGLVDLGLDLNRAGPGDLLVYDGHVVLLERTHKPIAGAARFRGDIIHATGGRDIRRAGEGIQRERFIDLATFRGALRRILRHRALGAEGAAPAPATRLRPVTRRSPNAD